MTKSAGIDARMQKSAPEPTRMYGHITKIIITM